MEFLIGIGILVALGFWLVSIYNRLVALNQRVDQSYADIEVQLNQRHDLIPNLVETVKGYASHEKETLDAVVQARNSAVSATGPAAQASAEGVLTGALGKLFALAEAYPDLKANTNFLQLQDELSDVENKIAAARTVLQQCGQRAQYGHSAISGGVVRGKLRLFRKRVFRFG